MKRIEVQSIDQVRIISVIEVKSLIGEGTEDDPCRYLWSYFDRDGEVVALRDSAAEL